MIFWPPFSFLQVHVLRSELDLISSNRPFAGRFCRSRCSVRAWTLQAWATPGESRTGSHQLGRWFEGNALLYECFLFHVLLTGKVILGAYSVHIPFALCEGNTLSIEPVGADLLLFVLSLSSRLLFSDLSTVRTLVQTHVVQHDLTRNPGSREPLNHYAVYGVRRVLRVFRVYVEWPSPPLSTNLARDRPETIEFFLSVNATVEKKKKKNTEHSSSPPSPSILWCVVQANSGKSPHDLARAILRS